MESVSCHQKGLVMGNILWSVDKKIYSDKEDHTLAITGWAITRNQSECDFILYGSGKELFVPEPSRCERADVAKDLKETKDIKEVGNVGFTVKIPEIIKLAEEHEKLQLALRAGDEKEIIWEATAAEVKDFCEESLIEYHIDEEQITQESILTVRGWVVNQLEPDEIFVQGTDGSGMYDHQTKTSGRGRGKGDFRRREKKSGIQYYCQSGEYKRSEYLHLFQGKRCTENLYCKCKKNKTGKYRTVSADETAVSEEQAEESGIYKEKRYWKIYPLCEKFPA